MMLEMMFLCFTAPNGVSSATIHLPFSLFIGAKLQWFFFFFFFFGTHNVYHGPLQPTLLAAFLIAFSAYEDPLVSCIFYFV
jgi:hypothetical protein